MPRLLLSDEHWSKLREILLHKAIYNKRDLRMTVEGMLYCMRTDCCRICFSASRWLRASTYSTDTPIAKINGGEEGLPSQAPEAVSRWQ